MLVTTVATTAISSHRRPFPMSLALSQLRVAPPTSGRLRVGLDVVDIRRVSESMARFGPRFAQRLFSQDEILYAMAGEGLMAERLAARFAAKEAAIKAFSLSEAGIGWRDIEVQKQPDGACRLALHGRAADEVERLGVCEIALSLSHDGDYAAAVVTALLNPDSKNSHLS